MEIKMSPKGTESIQQISGHMDPVHSPKKEEKTTEGFYLPEAHRLIKAGYYKKAFILMEKHMQDAENIPSILKIKLIRRIMEALTKIISSSLLKGETREDKFIKMLEKSNSYLYLWHELLCIYITKTNPKFAHLHGLLDDLSHASEEELEALNYSKSRMSSQYIIGNLDSMADTGELKASMFARRLKKKKEINPKETDFIDNTFNFLGGPNIKAETFDGTEINVKNYQSAYRFLLLGNQISQDVEATLNPDLLNIGARVRLALGVFYSEFGKYPEAQTTFESTINVLQVEISLRTNRTKDKDNASAFMNKYKKTIRMLIIVFINISIIEEQQENYSRTLESLKVGWFFASKFLTPDEEIYKSAATLFETAMRKYDRYIKELGEIERIASGNTEELAEQENRKVAASDHFTKINEHLYNKFQYEQLNAAQRIIFISSPSPNKFGYKTPVKKGKGDIFEDNFDITDKPSEDKMSAPTKNPYFEASLSKSEADSQPGTRYNTAPGQSSVSNKERRRRKLKKMLNVSIEDKSYKLVSDKYAQEIDPEKDINQIELTQKEEEAYIAMLNKNIKRSFRKHYQSSRPATDPVTNENNNDFVDIDEYFQNMMEKKIIEKDEQIKLNPVDFRRILKNHAYFLNNEEFDKREFSFARKMITARLREDLSSEVTITTKYKPRPFNIAQLNEVKLDAYYHEVKIEVEKKILQRNAMLKNAKRPLTKSVQKEEWDSLKRGEQPTNNEGGLGRRVSIGTGNLNMLIPGNKREGRTEEIQTSRPFVLIKDTSTKYQDNRGYASHRPSIEMETVNRNTMSMKHVSEKIKNSIQLMMENVEKTIEEGDNIKKRIEENKPIVELTKPRDNFLKVENDLAKSTYLLAERKDLAQKTWNLNDLLKGQKGLGGKLILKEKKKL